MGEGKKREKTSEVRIIYGRDSLTAKEEDREVYLDADRSLSLGGCSFLASIPRPPRVTKDEKKKKPKLFLNFNRVEAAEQHLEAPLPLHHFRARGSVLRASSPAAFIHIC